MIGIIDYGMGNLGSVQKAFEVLGVEAKILHAPAQMGQVDRLVLPGVGAFADGMAQLQQRQWDGVIHQFIASGRPFLGICLGMQLLFESSQEDATDEAHPVQGLGVLKGQVVEFKFDRSIETSPASHKLKVPHIGWNQIHWQRPDPLFAGLEQASNVYFVHGFYAKPADESIISARTDYGGLFCSSIWSGNIWATQFHPEKSQRVGLTMLNNFAHHR